MPQMKTNMPSAMGEGNPSTAQITPITTPAIKATVIWLPTKAPIRFTIPLVRALILGRRDAGANLIPDSITFGNEIVKYIVRTKIVKKVKMPEMKVLPTPTMPPNALTNKVPFLVSDVIFWVSESTKP